MATVALPMDHSNSDRIDTEWWAATLPRVRAFVQRRLRPELAQLEAPSDIVQSACRELLSDLQREAALRGDGRAQRWQLLRRALRKIVQKHRYHAARKRNHGRSVGGHLVDEVLESATGPPGKAEAAERAVALAGALQRLPEKYQRIIEWVHFDRLPHAEVGRRLGCSEAASKMLLSRAMARLAVVLGEV